MKKNNSEQQENFIKEYKRHFKDLLKFSLLRVSDKDAAVDIVQETFAKAWRYIFLGGVIKNTRAFLYKTLKNNIVNYYRAKKSISLDNMIEKEHFDIRDKGVEVTAEDRSDSLIAFKRLEDIPKKDKRIIIMHFVKGMNFKNIAKITKRSENTVVVQFHRAIKKVRNLFYHENKRY